MTTSLFRPTPGRETITVDPPAMAWEHLDFRVVSLAAGQTLALDTDGRETAIVPMAGSGAATADGTSFALSRRGVFEQPGDLLYVPPGVPATLVAETDWKVAYGSAPASGRYPVRLIGADEVRVELRGGGMARRQVNHLLAPPLPAERLIVFEVFVPAGSWAGWPPHRHDGVEGSPYLEEIYLFRFDRPDGFGFHRNYDGDDDDTFTVSDLDCVAVPRGFHVTGAAPGHNMWILNFLAGTPVAEDRACPPYFDPATTWITDDWDAAQIELPVRADGARTTAGASR